MHKNFVKNYVKDQQPKYKKMTKKVKEHIDSYAEYYKAQLIHSLAECESPIEQLFHLHFRDSVDQLRNELRYIGGDSAVSYCPQEEVSVNGKKYRLDFSLICIVNGKTYKFAIECDGHDFHEKTKEQVARDKKRERSLIGNGYRILRFTGSEIWNNPSKCSMEAYNIITKTTGIDDFWAYLVEKDRLK